MREPLLLSKPQGLLKRLEDIDIILDIVFDRIWSLEYVSCDMYLLGSWNFLNNFEA